MSDLTVGRVYPLNGGGYSFRNDGISRYVDLHFTPQQEIMKQVSDRLANDTEGKFRQALIDLGWTPPADT